MLIRTELPNKLSSSMDLTMLCMGLILLVNGPTHGQAIARPSRTSIRQGSISTSCLSKIRALVISLFLIVPTSKARLTIPFSLLLPSKSAIDHIRTSSDEWRSLHDVASCVTTMQDTRCANCLQCMWEPGNIASIEVLRSMLADRTLGSTSEALALFTH